MAFAFGVTAFAASAVTLAQSRGAIELTWHAGAGCPSREDVLGEIARLLGAAPAGEPRLFVDALARREGRRWILDLKLRDAAGAGERSVRGDSCEELADAAALIVALAFDPDAVAATQRRAEVDAGAPTDAGIDTPVVPVPSPDAPVLPAPAVVARPVPRAPSRPGIPDNAVLPPEPAQPWWGLISAHAIFDIGSLPDPAFGIGGSFGVRWDPILVRLRGAYFPGAEETVADQPSKGGDFGLWLIAPTFCLTPWHNAAVTERAAGDLALDACAAFELGQMLGEGFGVRSESSGSALWLMPTLDVELAISIVENLSATIAAGAGAPILRPNFVLNDVGIVHRASPVVGRGDIAVSVVF